MKHAIRKQLTGVLLAGLTGFAQAASNVDKIAELIQQYESALNASQTEEVLKLYGEQSVFMPQHAPAQIGKAAIKQAYDNVFNTIKLEIRFTTHAIEVFGDTAWARTSSAGQTKILAADAVVTEGNNELFIFKNDDGEWKIHQYLFSTNQARTE